MNHIHIVGTGPRTGTTLMTEAMIACFRIDAHADHEARIFTKPAATLDVYLTKAVKDILVANPFLEAYPRLHVICLMRDPRDMIVSRHAKAPDRYYAGLRYWNTYLSHWRRIRDHPRVITIRYEDLVMDADGTQETLRQRLPFLEQIAPFSRYHEHAAPSPKSLRALHSVRPITPEGVGAWRSHAARVAGQLEIHGSISADLIEFGYEQDASWLDELAGVVPDYSPAYWPEFFTRRNLLRRKLPAYLRVAVPWARARLQSLTQHRS